MTAPAAQSELRPLADLKPHRRAGELPPLTAEELAALQADIAAHGIESPLHITENGVVLDGHARLHAAQRFAIESVPVLVVDPEDEFEFMLRAALHRRQLSASEKAAVAVTIVDLARLREEARQRQHANLRQNSEVASLPARGERTREIVAELAGTSPRTVQDVLTVHEHDPQLFEQVMKCGLSASTAASKVRRRLRDAALPPPPPLPEGPFQLILADPPWTFGSPDSPFGPEQHYPTMSTTEIKALAVPAADNCVLFLWACNFLLPDALAR